MLQAWGGGQDTFEQAPLPGSEWGRANNVVPSQQADAPASPLVLKLHIPRLTPIKICGLQTSCVALSATCTVCACMLDGKA